MNLRVVLTMAGVALRGVSRDRTALFFMVVLPVLIILLIGLAAFGDPELPLGVVDEGSGPLGKTVVEQLERGPGVEVERFSSTSELRQALRRDVIVAGVVVPADHDARLRSGDDARIVMVADFTGTTERAAQTAVASVVSRQGARVGAARFASEQAGGTLEENLERARTLDGRESVTVETDEVGGAALPSGFGYTAPANLVLFVFVNSLAGAAALIETRRLGIARRLLAAPVSPATVVAGQTLGYFAIALGQALLILGVGALLFDVDWGSPPAASALVLVWALVGTGAGTLVGSVLRTPEQATSIGPFVGMALGMLGGCMWPLEIVGPTMRTIGHLVPHAWAMDGFVELVARRGELVDIAPQLAVLTAWAAVLLVLATTRLRRALQA